MATVNSNVVMNPSFTASGQEQDVHARLCYLDKPDWLVDVQTCSAQQSCNVSFGKTRNIVLNLDRSFRFVERDCSHPYTSLTRPSADIWCSPGGTRYGKVTSIKVIFNLSLSLYSPLPNAVYPTIEEMRSP
jgi:hypothetical protein